MDPTPTHLTPPGSCEFCRLPMQFLYPVTLGQHGSSRMARCPTCHSTRITPPFDPAALNQYYQDDYFKAADWELHKSALLATDYWQKISSHANSSASSSTSPWAGPMLEIGSGFGHFARLLHQKTALPIDVVEPNKACQQYMQTHGLTGHRYDHLTSIPAGKQYAHVFAFHVVEHLQTLTELLTQLAPLTPPGAKLWILTPNASSRSFHQWAAHWGWACPTQHYQFLSQHIPPAYFAAHGYTIATCQDLAPAPIHFPSSWRQTLHSITAHLTQQISTRGPIARLPLKVLRRLSIQISTMLEQNRPTAPLLAIEQAWSRHTHRRPHDELLLVLQRQAPNPTAPVQP